MILRLLSVQQDQSQKTYLRQLCTIIQHKSDFVLSGIIESDVKLHVYYPFSVSLYIRVALIYNRCYFIMNYFHHTFHSLISLAELCILFTWAIPFIMESFSFNSVLCFLRLATPRVEENSDLNAGG